MKIHHIGYAVKDINISKKEFEKLGYCESSGQFFDQKRSVNILFMKNGSYLIELISPSGDNSPINALIKKQGDIPYHICYEVRDILTEINKLKNDKYLLIDPPSEAIALENKKVAFLFKKGVGIIELIELEN